MAIQQEVTGSYPWGIEGARSGQNVVNGIMRFLKEDGFEGHFLFESDDLEERNSLIVLPAGTIVAGFAERWMTRPITDPTQRGSLSVRAGDQIHCQTTGDFYARTTTTASVGQEVFARQTDGAIVCADPTDTPPAGSSKTGYAVYLVDPSAAVNGVVPADSLIAISTYYKVFSEPTAGGEG